MACRPREAARFPRGARYPGARPRSLVDEAAKLPRRVHRTAADHPPLLPRIIVEKADRPHSERRVPLDLPQRQHPAVFRPALLERRTALEDERVPERIHLPDAGQNPGEQIVAFEDLPRNAETPARFLKPRPKGLHAGTFPGRFSWIIHRASHGPLRGPVGSSLR